LVRRGKKKNLKGKMKKTGKKSKGNPSCPNMKKIKVEIPVNKKETGKIVAVGEEKIENPEKEGGAKRNQKNLVE